MRFLTISNLLSLLRAPLAFLFLLTNPALRLVVLALAALTDSLDGFIARRWGKPTQFGAVLDPVMDKFFMLFVFSILVAEGRLGGWEMVAMLSRDIALFGFIGFLFATKQWKGYRPKSVWSGKVSTVAQYVFLFLVVLGVYLPSPTYLLFVLFALLYLVELGSSLKRS